MITVVCVLKRPGEFEAAHVSALARGAHKRLRCRFVCITNSRGLSLPLVEPMELEHDWPGWWSMMEMYRVPGPALYLDLDTVIIGDLEPLAAAIERLGEDEIIMLRPPRRQLMETAIVGWSGDMSWLTEAFADEMRASDFTGPRMVGSIPRPGALVTPHGSYASEAYWVTEQLEAAGVKMRAIQDVLPGFAQSYKIDLRMTRNPTGAIVYFHGKPRPWELVKVPSWMQESALACQQ